MKWNHNMKKIRAQNLNKAITMFRTLTKYSSENENKSLYL